MAAPSDPAARSTIYVFDALDESHQKSHDELLFKLKAFYMETNLQHGVQKTHSANKDTTLNLKSKHILHDATDMVPRIRLQDEKHYEKLCGEINSVIKIKVDGLSCRFRLSPEVQQIMRNCAAQKIGHISG